MPAGGTPQPRQIAALVIPFDVALRVVNSRFWFVMGSRTDTPPADATQPAILPRIPAFCDGGRLTHPRIALLTPCNHLAFRTARKA